MSESRALRISSRLTSGAVLATGTVSPSWYSPEPELPGSSSKNMSLSPVVGRIRIVASLYTGRYSRSISNVTTPRPSTSSTSATSPIRTPATRIVWP